MKIFHLRKKSSQHLLLPVWVVLGLVGRKLELAVPFSQLLQMKVHLDMFGIKKSCFVERTNFFMMRVKKGKHTSPMQDSILPLVFFRSRGGRSLKKRISQNITIYYSEQCNKYPGGKPSTGSPEKVGILCQRRPLPSGRDNFPTFCADPV